MPKVIVFVIVLLAFVNPLERFTKWSGRSQLCIFAIMLSLSVSSLDGLGTSKNKMHPQNKMLGSDPFYFHFIFYFYFKRGFCPLILFRYPGRGWKLTYLSSMVLLQYVSVLKGTPAKDASSPELVLRRHFTSGCVFLGNGRAWHRERLSCQQRMGREN